MSVSLEAETDKQNKKMDTFNNTQKRTAVSVMTARSHIQMLLQMLKQMKSI